MTDRFERQRSEARARLALMLGMYAGSQPRTPLADEAFMQIGRMTLTWLDMLLLTNAEDPQQYCRREAAQPTPAAVDPYPKTTQYLERYSVAPAAPLAPDPALWSEAAPGVYVSGGGGDFAGAGASGTWEAASSPVDAPASAPADSPASSSSDSGSASSDSSSASSSDSSSSDSSSSSSGSSDP